MSRIGRVFENALTRLGRRFGYKIERLPRHGLRKPISDHARLYVGCGEHNLPGYVGCDLRDLPNVSLVAKAWEVSTYCTNLQEIYSRHLLEHLTLLEVRTTLQDWHKALAPDGFIRLEVPNLDLMVAKWSDGHWSQDELDNKFSKARWGLAGLYGWQRECDPNQDSYSPNYWDVHKMGFNASSMKYFLGEAGFTDIEIWTEGFTQEQMQRRGVSPEDCNGCHLMATARKNANAKSLAA